MSICSRVFLLVVAAALVLTVFGVGTAFTYSIESTNRASGGEFFWLLLAALFASPLWLPAVIPPRLRTLSVVTRWLSAVALFVPIRYVGGTLLHQFQVYPGEFFSIGTLAVSTLLTIGCMTAVVVLLIPGLRRVHKGSGYQA